MYLHRRLFLWGAAAVLATLGTTRVLADEKGDALLKDVEAATKNVKTLSADLSMSEIVKAPDGKETVLKMAGTVKLKKPNLARMEFTSGPFAKTIASDGKNVYTLMPGNQYRKATVDANGRAINTFWATPLSMFFSGKFTSLVGDKAPALYVGKKIVDGMEYDVIQMKGEKPLAYTMNLYVTSAKLVTRMDMAFTQGGQTGKMNAILTNVKVNASLPDATFAYVPPKTAKLYAPPSMEDYNKNLLPVGSVAPRFALSTPTGGKVALEEVLKTKKAVLINFWVHG